MAKRERPAHKYYVTMTTREKETVIEEVADVESAKLVLKDLMMRFRTGRAYKLKGDGKHTARIPMPDGNDIVLDIRRVY